MVSFLEDLFFFILEILTFLYYANKKVMVMMCATKMVTYRIKRQCDEPFWYQV